MGNKAAKTQLIHPTDPELAKKEQEAIKELIEAGGLSPTYGASNLMRLALRALYLATHAKDPLFKDEGLFLPSSRGKPSPELQAELKKRVKVVDINKTMRQLWKAARMPGQTEPPKRPRKSRKKTQK